MLTPEQIQQYREQYGIKPQPPSVSAMPSAQERIADMRARVEAIPRDFSKQPLTFKERAKMSFGDEKTITKLKKLEEEAGLRGKPDIGDIADILGTSFPLVGSVLGGLVGGAGTAGLGTVGGAALGASTGRAVQETVGKILDVNKKTLGESAQDVAIEGGLTYVGGKVAQKIAPLLTKIIPERLYSRIFKQTTDDFEKAVKTGALSELQKKSPKVFQDYVNKGIIKVGKSGQVTLNPTLAREAIDRGLKGSTDSMAKATYLNQLNIENQIRQILPKAPELTIANKSGYFEILKDIRVHLKDTGYGFRTENMQKAGELLASLRKTGPNKVNAETALELRRFIDGIRNTSSFRLDAKLTPKQEELKHAADKLRGYIAEQVPGAKELMNEYRFNIQALDDFVDYAIKTKNKQLINYMDLLLTGGAAVTGSPWLLGAEVIKRSFDFPSVLTGLGQGAAKAGSSLPFVGAQAGALLGNQNLN